MRDHRVGVGARHRQHRRVQLLVGDPGARQRLVGRPEQRLPGGPHADRVLVARPAVPEVQPPVLEVEHPRQRLGGAAVDPQQEARVARRGLRVEAGERGGQLDERVALHTGILTASPRPASTLPARLPAAPRGVHPRERAPKPGVHALFPHAQRRAGMYESFYLRAVAPDRPLGVWIRYTAHKHPSQPAQGSLWCTVFDGSDARRSCTSSRTDELSAPPAAGSRWTTRNSAPASAEGACGEARWSLRFASEEPELRHLPHALLYRAPLPRTKLTSPAPAARFEGTLELAERTIELDGWRGMVGHNWGAQHAERWIWLHGVGFEEDPEAWIDVAIGRVRVAGRTTPWVANGALRIDGERHRLGGLGARGLLVAERPERCVLTLPGAGGLVVEAHVQAPPAALAGWRYADPDGGHRVRPPPARREQLLDRRPRAHRAPARAPRAHVANRTWRRLRAGDARARPRRPDRAVRRRLGSRAQGRHRPLCGRGALKG